MLLDGKIDDDGTGSIGPPIWVWATSLGIMLPVYFAFSAFGIPGKGIAAAIALGTLILSVKMHFDLKKAWWFWAVISFAAIANGLIVIYVSFPNKNYTFPIVAPIGFADYLLISLCIRIVQKHMDLAKPLKSAQEGIQPPD